MRFYTIRAPGLVLAVLLAGCTTHPKAYDPSESYLAEAAAGSLARDPGLNPDVYRVCYGSFSERMEARRRLRAAGRAVLVDLERALARAPSGSHAEETLIGLIRQIREEGNEGRLQVTGQTVPDENTPTTTNVKLLLLPQRSRGSSLLRFLRKNKTSCAEARSADSAGCSTPIPYGIGVGVGYCRWINRSVRPPPGR